MDILRRDVKCEAKFPCNDDSCSNFPCNELSHNPNFTQDPVTQHSLELRKYLCESSSLLEAYHKLVDQLKSTAHLKEDEALKCHEEAKLLMLPDIPPFPKDYPFLGTLKCSKTLTRMKGRTELDTNAIDKQHEHFVTCVCVHSGCISQQKDVIREFVKTNDRFLKKFTSVLCQTRDDILPTKNTLAQLDFALLRVGFGGIKGLHNFYKEQIVKKHDLLLKASMDLYNECKINNSEVMSMTRSLGELSQ